MDTKSKTIMNKIEFENEEESKSGLRNETYDILDKLRLYELITELKDLLARNLLGSDEDEKSTSNSTLIRAENTYEKPINFSLRPLLKNEEKKASFIYLCCLNQKIF